MRVTYTIAFFIYPFFSFATHEKTAQPDNANNRLLKLVKTPVLEENKKKRNIRTIFSQHQLQRLEEQFDVDHYINRQTKSELSTALGLSTKIITVWFQNRRAKHKREEATNFSPKYNSNGISSNPGLYSYHPYSYPPYSYPPYSYQPFSYQPYSDRPSQSFSQTPQTQHNNDDAGQEKLTASTQGGAQRRSCDAHC